MNRVVKAELLDELPASDPGAVQSRRDLRRLNGLMGNPRTAARAIDAVFRRRAAPRLIEIGAGDGCFLFEVARRLACRGKACTATLLDRQPLVTETTRAGFEALGWRVDTMTLDVFDWIRQPSVASYHVVLTNLFLHHFLEPQLSELLGAVSRRCELFLAIEPRRHPLAWACSRLVGLLGCNSVTRHDAPASIRAGFREQELSRAWPKDHGWRLQESASGLFGHVFIAECAPE